MADVHTGHPSPERLAAFRLGRLPPADRAATEAHLARCDGCRRQLANLADATVLSVMRQPAGGTEAQGQPAPRPAGPRSPEVPVALANHPRYRVLQLLGRGGMGAVYQAEHQLMQRLVALKVIDQGLTGEPAAVERFRREVVAAARLTHPNIVTALDAEQVGDLHFLVMEYVEGTNLAALVARRRGLPVPEACNYVAQAAAGLEHARRCGMVHRDIKPHNLMLTPQGRVKVLDFGLARFVSESASQGGLTQQGSLMGTPDYIAPEQSEDPRTADIRADVYSLGCTLYCLLAGRPPFPEGTLIQKVMAHRERTPMPLRQLRPDVPPALEQVVARMMAKQLEQRYQTPADVMQALAPFHGAGKAGSNAPAPPEAIPLAPAAMAVPARPASPAPSATAAPDWSSLTDDAPPPAADTDLSPRKVLPVALGAAGLLVVVVGLVAVVAVLGLTEARSRREEAKVPPPAPTAPAAPRQAGWPLELVQQGKIPAPDMSGRPILFNANFADSNNGFWVGTSDDKEKESSYRDGKLRVRLSYGEDGWWHWTLPEEKRYSNFACEFVGRVVRPRSGGWACVLCGPNGRSARVNIDSDGALHLVPYASARDPWSEDTGPLNRTFRHRAIKPRGEANALLCVVRGRQLELYVNGVAVQNPITFDKELTPTAINYGILGGADGGEVEFERITVWSVEDLPPPEARGVPAK